MSRVATRRLFLNPSSRSVRRVGAVALACASIALASCGGGDRKSYFTPDQVVAFGDENSVMASFTSSNLQDKDGNQVTLKGLSYTAQVVGVLTETCDNNATEPALCTAATSNTFDPGVAVTDTPRYMLNGATNAVSTISRDTTTSPGNDTQRVATTIYSCSTPRTWVQIVASAYGKGFGSDCPLDARGGAVSYALAGAKTDAVIAQINAHRGELNSKTVVAIMVGQNDILELFRSGSTTSVAAAELQARADRMSAAIKSVIDTGAKVVLALTPDLSQAPVGVSDPSRMEILVKAYNDRLYITGLGNVSGRSLAGINPESLTKPGIRSTSYDYTTPLCNASAVRRPDGSTPGNDDEKLLYCTTPYFNTAGTVSSFTASTAIWADATRAAPLLHNLIGVTVFNRGHEQF